MKTGFDLPEIEQAAISCLMQWPEETMPVLTEHGVETEHFQTPANRILFDCLKNFWNNKKPFDLICFTHELREVGLLESIGGAFYVTQTWCNTCHSKDVGGYYAGIIAEAHAIRLAELVCLDSAKQTHTPLIKSAEVIDSAITSLSAIPKPAGQRKHRTLLEAVQEKIERMEKGEPDEDVIKTGITKIDEGSPLRHGDMPLIVGQRKSGKSILALSVALNVARQGTPVLIFSLEDREPKLVDRLLAGVSRVPINDHHMKKLSEKALEDTVKAVEVLGRLPIHIKDDVFDLAKLLDVARELKARCNIGLIVVDYGQLVRVPDRKDMNREQKVAEVSRSLRLLAMELDTPIIVLSQLNADGQTRESRALEQDATACWEIRESKNEKDEGQKIRFIEIPWQRNGASGITFKVTFLGEIARVENYVISGAEEAFLSDVGTKTR